MEAKRILFVPDAIDGEESGARSARATVDSLIELGYIVGVYVKSGEGSSERISYRNIPIFRSRFHFRFYSHFYDPYLLKEFKNIINIFNPEYIFFAGSIQKPSILSKECRRKGIKTIYLFYINDYFCSKIYAGLESGPCLKCIEINSFQAINNNCFNGQGIYYKYLKGLIVRKILMKEIKQSYRVVGYSDDHINIYGMLGINNNKCKIINFQFDIKELVNIQGEDGEYFLIYGQPTIEKGWHTLDNILSYVKSNIKIKIIFKDIVTAEGIIKKFSLKRYVNNGIIEPIYAVEKRERLLELLSGARAVIIPTYYPTTGEFVLLESMSLGKPVLVFDVGAQKEIITHNINGLKANVGDFVSFSKNIDRLNSDSDFRKEMSNGAKAWAYSNLVDPKRLKLLSNIFL